MENLVWQLEKAVEAQWEQAGTFLVTREPEKRHPCWTSMVVRLRSVDAAAGTCASLKSAENRFTFFLSLLLSLVIPKAGANQELLLLGCAVFRFSTFIVPIPLSGVIGSICVEVMGASKERLFKCWVTLISAPQQVVAPSVTVLVCRPLVQRCLLSLLEVKVTHTSSLGVFSC